MGNISMTFLGRPWDVMSCKVSQFLMNLSKATKTFVVRHMK